MSESNELYQATWASKDEELLRVAVDLAEKAGATAGPIKKIEMLGLQAWAVRLASTKGPLPEPPKGVSDEPAPVAGVFMGNPAPKRAPLPTPLQWMDRLPPDRQVALLEAMDRSPKMRWLKARMLAAQEIDPSNAETVAGVQALTRLGVLTAEEADTLLAP